MPSPATDVVFYVPTVAPLLAGDASRTAGGAETQVRLLTRALAAAGVRVAVVAYAHPLLPEEDEGVKVVPRPPHAANPFVEAARIAAALRRVPSTAVVTRQAGAHTGLAGLAARAGTRRFVYSAANVLDFDFGSWERHPLKRALFETGLRLAHEVVAQTDEQRELGRRKLGRDLPVIRSIAEPAPLRTAAGDRFLWAGRVVGYKQPLAYVELARAVPEAQFEMVAVPDEGLESDRRLLAELRRQAAGVANLRLLPPCPRKDLLERMERAVAVVSTSSSEGMPNIWLEGWVRGIPALTLAHDPDHLIARNGLGLSATGDPARLARAARELWSHRGDLTDLAERCRTYAAAEHAPEAVAAKWRSVLRV